MIKYSVIKIICYVFSYLLVYFMYMVLIQEINMIYFVKFFPTCFTHILPRETMSNNTWQGD